MKLRHIFAAVATAGILVSCSKTKESYIEEMCDLKNEAADIIMNCHTWDDAFDAADKLHAIADEIKELEEDAERHAYDIHQAELSMTQTEKKAADENLKNQINAAEDKMKRAKEHLFGNPATKTEGNDAGKSNYLQFAVSRVD